MRSEKSEGLGIRLLVMGGIVADVPRYAIACVDIVTALRSASLSAEIGARKEGTLALDAPSLLLLSVQPDVPFGSPNMLVLPACQIQLP